MGLSLSRALKRVGSFILFREKPWHISHHVVQEFTCGFAISVSSIFYDCHSLKIMIKESQMIWHVTFFTPQVMQHIRIIMEVISHQKFSLWRHQMETFSALLALWGWIHQSPVNSPHKGQWRGALLFSLICAWINGWVNNRESGDVRRHRAYYNVIVMIVHWQRAYSKEYALWSILLCPVAIWNQSILDIYFRVNSLARLQSYHHPYLCNY